MVLNYFFILLNFLGRNIKKKKLFILNAEKRRKKKINCISILIVLVFPLNKVKLTQRGGIKIREEENFFYMIVMNYIHCSDTGVHISFPFPAIGKTLPANKC